jgi:hypothetical protein
LIRYRDFVTGKPRFTRGTPVSVITDGLGIERLVVERRSDTLFIALWCLDRDAKRLAESLRREKTNKRLRKATSCESVGP